MEESAELMTFYLIFKLYDCLALSFTADLEINKFPYSKALVDVLS